MAVSIPTHEPQGRQTAIQDALIADTALARRRTAAMMRQKYGPAATGPTSRRLWNRSGPRSAPATPQPSPRLPPASCWTCWAGQAGC